MLTAVAALLRRTLYNVPVQWEGLDRGLSLSMQTSGVADHEVCYEIKPSSFVVPQKKDTKTVE